MSDDNQTEIQKLGPDYRSIVIKSLGALAIAVSSISYTNYQFDQVIESERLEVSEMSKLLEHHAKLTDDISDQPENRQATNLFVLRSVLEEKKAYVDELAAETGLIAQYLGQRELREERSAQIDSMIQSVSHELDTLNLRGYAPFDDLMVRREEMKAAAGQRVAYSLAFQQPSPR